MFSPTDTIVAIATPPGHGAIGIVRISGVASRGIVRALLSGPGELKPRHATLTRLLGPDGQPQDEVLATLFPGPHSYTTEDVIEISAHGSPALLRDIVRGALRAGARLAEPGEFTFRAFINGRIDLVQAEAVADLVDAVTPLQARVAFDQLEGTLTRAIGRLDEDLFDLAARLEASLDFPEEGYHFVRRGETRQALQRVCDGVETLLSSAGQGGMIREGRQIAILGKPNVGKSSLFNWLVGVDRAIVAALPGTTRDLVTETIDFEGIRLRLVDTAGLRVSEDAVEREGISRARSAGEIADLVLAVFDLSRPFDHEDERVLAQTASTTRVIVWNKSDLAEAQKQGPSTDARKPGPSGPRAAVVSLKTGAGLDGLRAAIRGALEGGAPPLRDTPMVTNLRHEVLLRQAQEALRRAIAGLDERGEETAEDLVLADIASARVAFESVTGKRTTEDVLRQIFSRFCIGK